MRKRTIEELVAFDCNDENWTRTHRIAASWNHDSDMISYYFGAEGKGIAKSERLFAEHTMRTALHDRRISRRREEILAKQIEENGYDNILEAEVKLLEEFPLT